MGIDLALIWAIIIGFGVMMYVIMDGFDLGIGILYPFIPDKEHRDVAMNTVAPVWDGNETWLVLGGAGLLAAFPLVYSVVLTALYLPLIFMLLGLIFRGIAFEFRFKARDHERHVWDKAFIGGSFTATFFQGVVLGAYISGLPVENGAYTGGPLDWIAPFPLFTGISLVFAYALLGSTWLIMKSEGELQLRMFHLTRPLSAILLVAIVVISIWTPLRDPAIAARWFSFPNLIWFAPVPLLVTLAMVILWRALTRGQPVAPFLCTLALMFLGYAGLAISGWPNILPPDISLWQAAAPPQSMGFALVGALLIIPFILMYTAFAYYVFRGKVRPGDQGYH
ncbi:cytochrome d ubiquinol oxidase subunit II [Alloalcanivorax mobilis]|uniref:cytochrome d ubiquinol oxidase subunit II n=1 Tax=Alloalcanivorax mobilis TaxID=2019569 RepID=UPI000B5B2B54|nr:cytochrome d ubiquinol oxidase subunit II [Alloalcanivorax mobilis]ASK34607.1 cytochrome d ubiquinol oxidase subunit II [Alcanivorax sp. N3-2A]|tara:strand:- start:15342 stop:16352 length:1011 start_codon:yes stop_codon:yes gene_type:complete